MEMSHVLSKTSKIKDGGKEVIIIQVVLPLVVQMGDMQV